MITMPRLLQSLHNPIFARLYAAQTINLIGDSLTWVGLALLAFELAGSNAGVVLSIALTLRVATFVLLAPFAGVIADRTDRKQIMVITHLARMVIVSGLPFVHQVWQIYAIVLALNGFSAFFTPTYKATIPLVTEAEEYPQAIALSSATYQLLGVLGPGLAGSVAAYMGARQIFFLDAITFLIAALLIFSLSVQLQVQSAQTQVKTVSGILKDIYLGTNSLFADSSIRYALLMQLIAAIAGAQILVNTVGYVEGVLHLGKLEYGWMMATFGVGAAIASVILGSCPQAWSRPVAIGLGAMLMTVALLPANSVGWIGLLILWGIAGAGQSMVDLSTQTLIADRVAIELQGRVYGAHFAWSHLWWGFSYPLAGWMGQHWPTFNFLYGGLLGLILYFLAQVVFGSRYLTKRTVS